MKKVSLEALARLPEKTSDYKDKNGFVYLDVPASEAAENGWVELTMDERQAVVPLQETDVLQWEVMRERNGAA